MGVEVEVGPGFCGVSSSRRIVGIGWSGMDPVRGFLERDGSGVF